MLGKLRLLQLLLLLLMLWLCPAPGRNILPPVSSSRLALRLRPNGHVVLAVVAAASMSHPGPDKGSRSELIRACCCSSCCCS